MAQSLSRLLSRWELDPPIITADEVRGDFREIFGCLREQGFVRQTTPAGSVDCTECSRRCRVEFVADSAGVMHGFIHCRDCGISEVPRRRLERWQIETGKLLSAVYVCADCAIHERVPGQLWQVGKATWAGRPRDVWFGRGNRADDIAIAVETLPRRPKAIVFTPTEHGAGRWQDEIDNLVIALESALSFDGREFRLDIEHVESRIIDAGLGLEEETPERKPRKRAERAANIERIKNELIAHLRSARDHAFATKDQSGEPQLLPRPTQKELAGRVRLTEPDVSRCLKDESARELRIYWELALNLDQIMAWKGPLNGGRKA